MTYIDPGQKLFAHLDRLAAWRRGEKPAPVTLEIDLSNACILGCQSCHFAHTHVKGPWATRPRVLPMAHDPGGSMMDTVLVSRILREARAAGVESIVWSGGGEPTLHPAWTQIVLDAWRLGFQQGMYTLGGRVQATTAQVLKDSASWVVVSLDCKDAATYAAEKGVRPERFDDACAGIRHLAGGPAVVGVSFLLHADNWADAWTMLTLARTLGADYTTFRPTITTSPAHPAEPLGDRAWVTDALPLLEVLSHERDVECRPARFAEWRDWTRHPYATCYGIRLNATITPDGRMWVCPNRRELGSASCLGDLKAESFAAIWARHPGHFAVDRDCRAHCRLHTVNTGLAAVYAERPHEAFI